MGRFLFPLFLLTNEVLESDNHSTIVNSSTGYVSAVARGYTM
jgi:hypothetical protein